MDITEVLKRRENSQVWWKIILSFNNNTKKHAENYSCCRHVYMAYVLRRNKNVPPHASRTRAAATRERIRGEEGSRNPQNTTKMYSTENSHALLLLFFLPTAGIVHTHTHTDWTSVNKCHISKVVRCEWRLRYMSGFGITILMLYVWWCPWKHTTPLAKGVTLIGRRRQCRKGLAGSKWAEWLSFRSTRNAADDFHLHIHMHIN